MDRVVGVGVGALVPTLDIITGRRPKRNGGVRESTAENSGSGPQRVAGGLFYLIPLFRKNLANSGTRCPLAE